MKKMGVAARPKTERPAPMLLLLLFLLLVLCLGLAFAATFPSLFAHMLKKVGTGEKRGRKVASDSKGKKIAGRPNKKG